MERPDLETPLKWAGGKRWLIPYLETLYDKRRRLVDPFGGGLSVPLGLKPERCLFSDVNPHLMNFWRWLQYGLEWDDSVGIEFKNDHIVYYDNRNKFNALCAQRQLWTREGALLFYYLNRTCFNGLCRFNNSGYFNVPFGKYKTVNYRTSFLNYRPSFEGWQLYIGDFESLPLEPDDFIYADPPYDVEFTQFAPRDFHWADQERLAVWLARHKGPVVASNQATPRVVALYESLGFKVYKLEAPRSISSSGDRTPAEEIIALKGGTT